LGAYLTGGSFGFEDGISQPLLRPIDDVHVTTAVNMFTDPHIIIVTDKTKNEATDQTRRPPWMYNGSFLAFRKLEQDVKAFEELTDKHKEYGCTTKGLLGAKLMGRWPTGKFYVGTPILACM
jgi:deferrochelatase/peroxidase EfeB